MMFRIAILAMTLGMSVVSHAADDTRMLLDKALDQLVRHGYTGDTSSAERYLQAILEREPTHLEARWQLIYLKLVPLKNSTLSERARALSHIAPEFARLTQRAKELKQTAFLHYVTAVHAGFYEAYQRALSEIDRALALEPTSVRYLTAKGKLLVGSGHWAKRDAEIEKGIRVLKQARAELQAHPSPFVLDGMYDFYLAGAFSELTQPRWQEVADHYQRFIEKASPSVAYAFALNNVSIAYKHLGACGQAKDAAEKALQVMKFGAAESNKRHAEFCIEMQRMGLLAKR